MVAVPERPHELSDMAMVL